MNVQRVVIVLVLLAWLLPIAPCAAQCPPRGYVVDLPMRLPYNGTHRVTQGYCTVPNPPGHSGYQVDFGDMPNGTDIVAVADGHVIQLGTFTGLNDCSGNDTQDGGKFVRIQHQTDNGTYYNSAYLHLSVQSVVCGQQVIAGQKIGESGETGCSDGPHLHFHIRLSGAYAQDDVPTPCGSLPVGLELGGVRPTGMVYLDSASDQDVIRTNNPFIEQQNYTAVGTSNPGWSFVNLHPSGTTRSQALSVRDGRQGGFAEVSGDDHAYLWTGTPVSGIDLNPSGAGRSRIYAVSGSQQIGESRFEPDPTCAGVWTSGTPGSWQRLTSPGIQSTARGGRGNIQVGYATIGGQVQASVWNGTIASRVNLHLGSSSSHIYASDGNQHVGDEGLSEARMWTGTSGSWVNMDPPFPIVISRLFGVDGGEQAGYIYLLTGSPPSQIQHAGLWRGNSGSFVDLHPGGAQESAVWAVDGGQQVGYAVIDGGHHAGLWGGTASSWTDLHSLLPPVFLYSQAKGVTRPAFR